MCAQLRGTVEHGKVEVEWLQRKDESEKGKLFEYFRRILHTSRSTEVLSKRKYYF